jgi:LuxR family maltose regulon positive regulatory protein
MPPKRVQRPHLLQRLNEGLETGRRITLVSAPAGFGKTACISAWAHNLDRIPVSWLSLDPSDDDPAHFFAYFIAALQEIDARLGQEIEGVLRAGQLPPAEVVTTTLCNDLLKIERRFVLVLDDFQAIQDGFILQVLEKLVLNLPPALHLVLLTREDPSLPMARLRANNLLNEIRAGDLRFRRDEAQDFFQEVMALPLSNGDVATLEEKTEGWIVGLQLAGLSVRGRPRPSDFIASLSGSHRFILGYLTEEVLNRQPEEIQNFLLQTAILDKLNGDLCNAVTSRSDSHSLLERLLNANLFLIPLDDEQQWYRYHHLFADLLRDLQNKLHKEKTAELHRRASRWYAQAGGEGGAFASEAIQHALAAKDYPMAVNLLERHAMEMIMQGYAKTVNGWVQAIPVEWGAQSPKTNLAFAWMHSLRGDYAQAFPYLTRLEASLSSSQLGEKERRSLRAEWLVMQSLLFYKEGNAAESLAMAEEALEIAPEEDSRLRSLAYFGLACAQEATGNTNRAVEAYQMAIQHGRAVNNSIAGMMSTSGLAQLAFGRGQLHLAFEIAFPVSGQVEKSGALPPISTVVFGILGEVYTQWYQPEQARYYVRRALQLSTLGGIRSGMIGCRLQLSRLSQLEGDWEAAAREIQKASELVRADTPDYVRQEVVAQQARIYLARDLPAAAEMALQGMGFSFQDQFTFPDLPGDQDTSPSTGLLYNSSLWMLLYRARTSLDLHDLQRGIDLANRLIAGTLHERAFPSALETLLLRAQAYALLGDSRASQADYRQALDLAEPEGFTGVFVEQGPPVAEALTDLAKQGQLGDVHQRTVERILAAFSGVPAQGIMEDQQPAPALPAGSGPGRLIEPLTERELEVMRLISEGLKYKEIAGKLFISLNTVRYHVKAIYGKLNVNSRLQAVETARQLGIL